jgi:hypothetical protein
LQAVFKLEEPVESIRTPSCSAIGKDGAAAFIVKAFDGQEFEIDMKG